MPVLVAMPWLALLPALALALAASRRGGPVGWAAAVAWALYAAYETAMQRRWLCTGECNIRVDLLLLHPLLLLGTIAALASLWRGPRRAGPRGPAA